MLRGFFASGPVAPWPPGTGVGGGAWAGASADAGAGAGAEADAAGTVVCYGTEPSNKSATSCNSLIASCFTSGLPLTHFLREGFPPRVQQSTDAPDELLVDFAELSN